jgi:hypothetical protein
MLLLLTLTAVCVKWFCCVQLNVEIMLWRIILITHTYLHTNLYQIRIMSWSEGSWRTTKNMRN